MSDQLLRLRQGASSTHKYTLQFCTLAATSGWNEAALLSAYRQGLETSIRAQMAIFDDSIGLESFMLKANRIAQRLSACHTAEAAHQPASPANGPQYQNPCKWTQLASPVKNVLAEWQRGCVFTVLRLITSSGHAPTKPHIQR